MFRRTWLMIPILALLGGCAPGNPGLLILNVVAPDETCTYATSSMQISQGLFDTSRPADYVAALRFGNQLISLGRSGTAGPPMANPNAMQVQQIEVELQDISGGLIGLSGPNPYTVPAGGGLVPSAEGDTPGEAVGAAAIIPDAYRADLAGLGDVQIIASVRAIGQTTGGAEVVSYPYAFPIQLCSGCLYACQMDTDGAAVCSPTCRPGQDFIHITPAECGTPTVCQVGGS